MTAAYGFLLLLAFLTGSCIATWYGVRSAGRQFDAQCPECLS